MDSCNIDSMSGYVQSAIDPLPDSSGLDYPFILMVDTQRPAIEVFLDTSQFLVPEAAFADSFHFHDNIGNARVSYAYGKGNGALTNWQHDTFADTILEARYGVPAFAASKNTGLRVWVIITDGHFIDTLNLSRQVRRGNSPTVTTLAQHWIPLRSSAILDSPQIDLVLADIMPAGLSFTYDNKQARLFRWYDCALNALQPKIDKWLEYSEATRDSFSLIPGRLLWLKTASAKTIDMGQGLTTSLRNPYEISLQPEAWTDFSLPFDSFSIFSGDIIDATGAVTDSLEFYHWQPTTSYSYVCEPLYIAGLPASTGLTNRQAELVSTALEGGYSVYNRSLQAKNLRIPPLPSVLSTAKKRLMPKKISDDSWAIMLRASADIDLSPVALGYSSGAGKFTGYAMPPSFSSISVAPCVRSSNQIYGHLIYHAPVNGGFIYELQFSNASAQAGTVKYRFDGLSKLNDSMQVILRDPLTGACTPASDNHSLPLDAHAAKYMQVLVGGPGFITRTTGALPIWQFGLAGLYPNPCKGLANIRFTLPYSGIRKVTCSIVDTRGRLLWKKVLSDHLQPGLRLLTWNGINSSGTPVAAGMYVVQLTALTDNNTILHSRDLRLMYLK
jgi:hypothetical protein